MSLLPEELETLVEKSGPFRSGGRSGVGLAWVRHMHTYTIELCFPVAAAASASASPASASLPGTHTHSDLRAVLFFECNCVPASGPLHVCSLCLEQMIQDSFSDFVQDSTQISGLS